MTSTPKTDEGKECDGECHHDFCKGKQPIDTEFSGATFERHHEHKAHCPKCYWKSDVGTTTGCLDTSCPCHEHKAVEGWEEEFFRRFTNAHAIPHRKLTSEIVAPPYEVISFISSLVLKAKAEGANVERKFIENVLDGSSQTA